MRQSVHRLIPILALAALLTACAARRPASGGAQTETPPVALHVEPPPDPAALIRRGCFTCLQRALAVAREQGVEQLAFEAAALLAIRMKELGIPSREWLDEARRLAPADNTSALILDAIEAIPDDPLSGSRDVVLHETPQRREAARMLPLWVDAARQAPVSPEFRVYVELALTCGANDGARNSAEERAARIPEGLRSVPLVAYRLGVCSVDHADVLRSVRDADAAFVDADYPLGRYAVQTRPYPDPDNAVQRLRAAAAAFPESPAIAATAGNVYQIIEAWPEALAAYEAALALVPDHPDARLGRTIALSNLNEHEGAIAAATQLIDGGRWFVGQAFYWRAWNQFQLANYPAARADADRARSLMVNAGVYLLSGMIDWRMRRLETAESDFQEALRMDFGQCEAATFLGGVRTERSKPAEALAAFTQARQCYELTIRLRREAIARLEMSDAPAAHKAREIARHERAIEQAERRRTEAVTGIDLLQKFINLRPKA